MTCLNYLQWTEAFADLRIRKGEAFGSEADLYSLGCILFFLYYGKFAYKELEDGELVDIDEIGIPESDEDQDFAQLIAQMATKDHTERISWQQFFENDYVKECLDMASEKIDEANEILE